MTQNCAKITKGGERLPGLDKTEVVLRRVEALLRDIAQTSNHGEITIQVIAGRIKVSGGPEIELT